MTPASSNKSKTVIGNRKKWGKKEIKNPLTLTLSIRFP